MEMPGQPGLPFTQESLDLIQAFYFTEEAAAAPAAWRPENDASLWEGFAAKGC
jgi:hypothetical protein